MARNHRFFTVLIGWAGFSLFFAAWLQFQWGGGAVTQRFDNLGETLVIRSAQLEDRATAV